MNELEENGFYDIPAECENSECAECKLDTEQKIQLDCPYLDERRTDYGNT